MKEGRVGGLTATVSTQQHCVKYEQMYARAWLTMEFRDLH